MNLDVLKFVRGAVSTKDLVPEMKHFVIQQGHVRGFNGVLALSSPIDFNFDCAPKAVPMVQAIGNCEDVVALGMTDANRLRITSGPFKAFIDCVDLEGLPHQQPEGQEIQFDGEQMLAAIDKLLPFVGTDASRPWTNGILLRGQSAFATNNVCLVEYWIGSQLPFTVNIPMQAIKEMARIGQPPTHAQICAHSMTFHYADGRWLRTQLYSTEWPDVVEMLNTRQWADLPTVAAEMFEGLTKLKPFLDRNSRVLFRGGSMYTEDDDSLGASYAVDGLPDTGIYSLKMLSLLEAAATHADFSQYPQPVPFVGHRLRGIILGQRA